MSFVLVIHIIQLIIKKENTIFINPGSMTFPRGQYPHPTYCVFETTNQEVTFYDLKTDSPCNPFEVKKRILFKRSLNNYFSIMIEVGKMPL